MCSFFHKIVIPSDCNTTLFSSGHFLRYFHQVSSTIIRRFSSLPVITVQDPRCHSLLLCSSLCTVCSWRIKLSKRKESNKHNHRSITKGREGKIHGPCVPQVPPHNLSIHSPESSPCVAHAPPQAWTTRFPRNGPYLWPKRSFSWSMRIPE